VITSLPLGSGIASRMNGFVLPGGRLASASARCLRKLFARVLTSPPDLADRQIGDSSSSS